MANEKIISKIQKLFARKESNFTAEAESALLKAQELMVQHGLTMQDIEGSVGDAEKQVCEEAAYHSQAPRWHGIIANILASNFRCKSIWMRQRRNEKRIRVITFIGYKEDTEIVKEAYMYAIALIKYNIRCIKKRYPRVTTAYINTYIDGFIDGLNAKFKEQVKRQEWGLILITPVPVQTHYDTYNPVTIKPKGRSREINNNPNAYQKGYIDGKTFIPDRKRLNV